MRSNLVCVMQQETVFPDKNSDKGKREQVQEMFDTISPAYDDLNRVMTLRMDISWRKNVRQYVAKKNPGTILDIATGTGDLAIELSKIPSAEIIAVDISQGMLSVGEKKVKSLGLTDRIHMQVLMQLLFLLGFVILSILTKGFLKSSVCFAPMGD